MAKLRNVKYVIFIRKNFLFSEKISIFVLQKNEQSMGKNDELWAVKSFDEKVREAAKEYVKEQKFFTLAEIPKIERAFKAGAEFATR